MLTLSKIASYQGNWPSGVRAWSLPWYVDILAGNLITSPSLVIRGMSSSCVWKHIHFKEASFSYNVWSTSPKWEYLWCPFDCFGGLKNFTTAKRVTWKSFFVMEPNWLISLLSQSWWIGYRTALGSDFFWTEELAWLRRASFNGRLLLGEQVVLFPLLVVDLAACCVESSEEVRMEFVVFIASDWPWCVSADCTWFLLQGYKIKKIYIFLLDWA